MSAFNWELDRSELEAAMEAYCPSSEKIAAFMADRLAMANSVAACQARIAESKGPIEQMAEALSRRELLNLPVREMSDFEVSKGSEITHRHTEPTAPRWPLTVATDGERNGRLAWVPGAQA